MNCPACGSPVEKDAQFCPKCYGHIEPPSIWRRFLSLFQSSGTPAQTRLVNLKKTVTIKTTGPDGQKHEYHSLADVPPEVRAEFEKMQAEAMKEMGNSAVMETSDGAMSTILKRKDISVFKIKDASGVERTYHSLEELPPEIRAAVEEAQRKNS